ncbi:hypothetical protein GCM10007963_22220 [Lutibacter litoralis]|nr:hypothetical protein GCM10007963_22220 [Lutibacter litoralis]
MVLVEADLLTTVGFLNLCLLIGSHEYMLIKTIKSPKVLKKWFLILYLKKNIIFNNFLIVE